MSSKRSAELLIGAFKDDMVNRRKFEVKNANGDVVTTLYFKPILLKASSIDLD